MIVFPTALTLEQRNRQDNQPIIAYNTKIDKPQ